MHPARSTIPHRFSGARETAGGIIPGAKGIDGCSLEGSWVSRSFSVIRRCSARGAAFKRRFEKLRRPSGPIEIVRAVSQVGSRSPPPRNESVRPVPFGERRALARSSACGAWPTTSACFLAHTTSPGYEKPAPSKCFCGTSARSRSGRRCARECGSGLRCRSWRAAVAPTRWATTSSSPGAEATIPRSSWGSRVRRSSTCTTTGTTKTGTRSSRRRASAPG